MTKRLFFIYTNPMFLEKLYRPVLAEAFDAHPEVEVRFVLDNSLLLDTLANGGNPTRNVVRRLYNAVENCVLAGADCVVVGCTALNTATKELMPLVEVPLISVDEPMIQRACASGAKRLTVVSHSDENARTVQRRLEAERPGAAVRVLVPQSAAEAFGRNDNQALSAAIMEAVQREQTETDAFVVAHIGCESVTFEGITVPVYRTGACCIPEIWSVLGR